MPLPPRKPDPDLRDEWKDEEIAAIALPLPGFQYQHTPEEGNRDQDRGLVGRDQLLSDLRSVLINTRRSRGSYLLAGFRGEGKTTLVNKALDIYNGYPDHLSWLPGGIRDQNINKHELETLCAKGKIEIDYHEEEFWIFNNVSSCKRLPEKVRDWLCVRFEDAAFRRSLALLTRRLLSVKLRLGLRSAMGFVIRVCHLRTILAAIFHRFLTYLRRFFFPIVQVHVNLATEGCLDARTVLFNTAFLLHRRLHIVQRRPLRRFGSLIIFISLAFLVWLLPQALPQLDSLIDEIGRTFDASSRVQIKLSDVIPLFTDAIATLPRAFFTLLLGNERTNAAIDTIHAGISSDIAWVFSNLGVPLLLVYLSWTRWLPTTRRIERRLSDLLKRGQRTEETDQGVDAGAGLRFGRKYTTPPLDAHRIEAELLEILDDCRRVCPIFGRPDVIFVFDELDKIAGERSRSVNSGNRFSAEETSDPDGSPSLTTREIYKRKERVDELLSTIKSFITEGQARFFFIAGREMLDSYQAERGSASSLYESLFNRVFEVPSLLTDSHPKLRANIARLTEAFVCRRLLLPPVATYVWRTFEHCPGRGLDGNKWKEPEDPTRYILQYKPYRLSTVYHWMRERGLEKSEARRQIFMLRHFINFLTLHSWGNCKRLNSLFEHFIKPAEIADPDAKWTAKVLWGSQGGPDALMLQFGRMDQQRIMLASSLFVLVQHHLSRQHSNGTDKLAVSLFAALQYLVKFHRFPFARNHLDRMDEVLSIHRSPELNTAIDTLINLVLRSHVRLIRNGLSRYRFLQGFEQEVRYIARISDIESASFNFSLDSTAGVKIHYRELLRHAEERYRVDGEERGIGAATIGDINITLGDLFAQEESFDQAAVHFQEAADVLLPRIEGYRDNPDDIAKLLLPCVEALLKLGDVNERRQRYERAAAVYTMAHSLADRAMRWRDSFGGQRTAESSRVNDAALRGDSKWDILKQPMWALAYLNLKRSPAPWAESCVPDPGPFYRCESGRFADPISRDAVYHYRAGQVAFFYGRHASACRSFLRAIDCSQNWDIGYDNERAAYIAGYSGLNLAESLLVAFMHRRHLHVRKRVRGRRYPDVNLQEILLEYVGGLFGLISTLKCVGTQEDLLACASESGELKLSVAKEIGRLLPDDDLLPGDDLYKPSPLDKLDLKLVLGIVIWVARRFERHGLSLHATIAYLKLVSLWACLLECIPLALVTELELLARIPAYPEAMKAIKNAHQWIEKIRDSGARNVQAIDAHAFTETWYKIWEWDVPGGTSETAGRTHGYQRKQDQLCEHEALRPGPGERGCTTLLENLAQCGENESMVWYHSPLYQKILSASIWEMELRCRITRKHFSVRSVAEMTPSSIRSLLFSHWIRGRELSEDIIAYCRCWSNRELNTYRLAGKAAHNLYRAHYYIRQMCGNDQDIMLPTPASVLYSLWRLLHALLTRELRKTGLQRNVGRERYAQAVRSVRAKLAERSDTATPGNYFDYRFVVERLLTYLRDVEQLSDLSSRPRASVLKGKYFLADDYEDPRFHLDWSMIQMFAPSAAVLRERVIAAKLGIFDSDDDA